MALAGIVRRVYGKAGGGYGLSHRYRVGAGL